ncbi:DUF6355 family natural product biosynthesis protein [Rhodococcus sp. NPDC055112]
MSVLKSRSLKRAAVMAVAAASIGGGLAVTTPSVAAAQGSSETPVAGIQCGYYTKVEFGTVYAYYRTCDLIGHRINVDLAIWQDEQRCVGSNAIVGLGSVGNGPGAVRNAWKIGNC